MNLSYVVGFKLSALIITVNPLVHTAICCEIGQIHCILLHVRMEKIICTTGQGISQTSYNIDNIMYVSLE